MYLYPLFLGLLFHLGNYTYWVEFQVQYSRSLLVTCFIFYFYFFLVTCFIQSGMYGDSADEEFACNEGDLALTPGLSRSPGEGNSHPLQYSGVENSMNCIVHRVTKSWTWPSDFHNMSVPISRFIPPPSSCLVTISLFSTSRTLFLFCK